MNKKIAVSSGVGIAIITVVVIVLTVLPLTTSSNTFQNEKLGLIVNTPSQSTTLEDLDTAYSHAANTGIGRNNVYMFWNIIEPEKDQYNFRNTDILMSFNKKNDLKVTLYFSVINGRLLGPFPDWMGNPSLGNQLEEKIVKTLDVILSRYDIIDSVIIGGELESQFRFNEDDIPKYEELFNNVYQKIKEKHPQVKMGNAFSLHGVINKNLEHVVEKLSIGDFVAFTYFPVNLLNDIEKKPLEAKNDLEKIFELVPNKKVALFEISWSTSGFVNGNEQDQVQFLKTSYEFFRENEPKLEFFTWYRQHDRPEGTCTPNPDALESPVSVGGGSGIGSSEFVIERIGKYTCNAGLINTEGIPKAGWSEFQRQIQMSTKS